ncbi:MAG: lysophospholipid acyltransferase family protein [Fodinibius sp.]|nr:lysophospholipid acyltransferase family protein [Fodinibius sp.]
MLRLNPRWQFDIQGADQQKITQPTIVVANHQSFLDLPMLYLLPWSMKWVAKKDLFKIPIFGWIVYMTGQIAIDRQSMRSVQKIDKLVAPIKNGIPAMIFPEGTRTQDGELQPFKNGAFKLAKRYNFNILPIVLDGGFKAMPSGEWRPACHQKYVISVLNPVPADQFVDEQELKKAVFTLMDNELSAQRSRAPNIQKNSD